MKSGQLTAHNIDLDCLEQSFLFRNLHVLNLLIDFCFDIDLCFCFDICDLISFWRDTVYFRSVLIVDVHMKCPNFEPQ